MDDPAVDRDDLLAEVRRVMHEGRFVLNSGGPLADRSGLLFTTEDEALLTSPNPQAALSCKYPVQVERAGPAIPL